MPTTQTNKRKWKPESTQSSSELDAIAPVDVLYKKCSKRLEFGQDQITTLTKENGHGFKTVPSFSDALPIVCPTVSRLGTSL